MPDRLDDEDGMDPNNTTAPLDFTSRGDVDVFISNFQTEAASQGASQATINKVLPIAKAILSAAGGLTPFGPAVATILNAVPNSI